MNPKRSSLGVERSVENIGSNFPRPYAKCMFIPQSWNSFQRLRHDNSKPSLTSSGQRNIVGTTFVKKSSPASNEAFTVSVVTGGGKESKDSKRCLKQATDVKTLRHTVKNDRWARTWANHRARQAVLTRSQASERSKSCESRSTERTKSMNAPRRSLSVRSRNIELDAKAAEVFSRLRSIYINEEERAKRLQCIRERMNEFQKKSIRKEVDKSIQEYNKKLKEDEQNRKELRRVREKFLETKKQRLKYMHVSRNALEVPAVSRLAYGLPKEGKEFSATYSSKKTTDEIKKLWRMAIVRKQCIDSFISKASQRHQELPGVIVKRTLRAPSFDTSMQPDYLQKTRDQKDNLEEESRRKLEKPLINSVAKIQMGILDSFESLSSEEEDFEK